MEVSFNRPWGQAVTTAQTLLQWRGHSRTCARDRGDAIFGHGTSQVSTSITMARGTTERKGRKSSPARDRHLRGSPGFSLPRPFSAPAAFLSCPSGSAREPGISPVWRRNILLVHFLPLASPSLYPHPTYPGLSPANLDSSLFNNTIIRLWELINPDFWKSRAARTCRFLQQPG